MWKLIAVTSLVLTLALGAQANASPSCKICIESVRADRSAGPTTLRFTARAADGITFPETGSGVIMQVDGQQANTKCVNVSLRKIDVSGGIATYSGVFNANIGQSSYEGRVDIGGDIHSFTVPLDGKPGTVKFLSTTTVSATQAPTAAPATSAPTTAPATAPQPVEPAPAPRVAGVDLAALTANPMLLLGLAVIAFTAIGVFFDRRRAFQRTSAA